MHAYMYAHAGLGVDRVWVLGWGGAARMECPATAQGSAARVVFNTSVTQPHL